MNYRHAFHAGNHADVLKHIVQLIDSFKRKDSPFFVLDTTAVPAATCCQRREPQDPGGRIRDHAADGPAKLPEVVERYLKAVQADNPVGALTNQARRC